MRTVLVILAVAVAASVALPSNAAAQSFRVPDASILSFRNLPDAKASFDPPGTPDGAGVDADFLRGYFHERATRPEGGGYLSAHPAAFYGMDRYEVSTLRLAFEGAEIAASAALFLSAIGTTVGIWDEETSWYLTGAAAAAGALWRGTAADDPGLRIRYRWEP